MADFQVGDRVRVTFEAQVRNRNSVYTSFHLEDGGGWVGELRTDDVTIEKIEPPVEVFKPGDVVRRKSDDALLLLTTEGYVYLRGNARGNFYPYNHGEEWVPLNKREEFNSEHYERVSIE